MHKMFITVLSIYFLNYKIKRKNKRGYSSGIEHLTADQNKKKRNNLNIQHWRTIRANVGILAQHTIPQDHFKQFTGVCGNRACLCYDLS